MKYPPKITPIMLDKGRIKLNIKANSVSASFKGRKRVKAN
jgi:hypothetical protein